MNDIHTYIFDSPALKQSIIDGLCVDITNTSEFIDNIEYLIDKMSSHRDVLDRQLYENEDNVILLVLSTYRRVWSQVYINPPNIFEFSSNYGKDSLKLYQSIFNPNDFFDYFLNTLDNTKDCLKNFKNIDRTLTHLTIITDDYLGYLMDKVKNSKDIKADIRKYKINKII